MRPRRWRVGNQERVGPESEEMGQVVGDARKTNRPVKDGDRDVRSAEHLGTDEQHDEGREDTDY